MDCISFLRELKQASLGAGDGVVADVSGYSDIWHWRSVAPNSIPNSDCEGWLAARQDVQPLPSSCPISPEWFYYP